MQAVKLTWSKKKPSALASKPLPARSTATVSVETGVRLDIHAAFADWRQWVAGMDKPPHNPPGHFMDFCWRRAREMR